METGRYIFRVCPKHIAYLRWTVEAYDGMAVVKTVDPSEAVVELRVSPGCEEILFPLLDALRDSEGVFMDRIDLPRETVPPSPMTIFPPQTPREGKG